MKDIAVVYKYSALESYSAKQIRRHKERNPELFHRMQVAHDEHSQAFENLQHIIEEKKLSVTYFERDTLSRNLDDFKAVISFGGDGTFINASHFIEKSLLLGINSSPQNSIGHYCRFELKSPSGVKAFRKKIISLVQTSSRASSETHLLRMQVSVADKVVGFPVLNDILFTEQNPAATSRYTLIYRGIPHDQKSSGLWVTTPTGSTAAYQSAGGTPFQLKELRFIVRELYSDTVAQTEGRVREKKLLAGSVKRGGVLELVSSMMHGALYLDGSHQKVPVVLGDHIVLSIHPHALRAIY